MKVSGFWSLLLLAVLSSIGLLSYVPNAAAVNANFFGEVIAIPCHVNNDQVIDYDFGKVIVNEITGENYTHTENINVVCDGSASTQLNLTIKGAAMGESHILKTDVADLGVALFEGTIGNKLPLNEKIKIEQSVILPLKAVLVNSSGKTLKTGSFKASATLSAEYD